MIIVLIVFLIILAFLPCSLFFEKFEDFFITIKNNIIKKKTINELKLNIKHLENINEEKQQKIKSLTDQLNEARNRAHDESLEGLVKKLNLSKENAQKTIDEIKKESEKKLQEKQILIDTLLKELQELKEHQAQKNNQNVTKYKTYNIDYRSRHEKPYRCEDGDYVRSKSEREIDNFFFQHKIWHIYESEYEHPYSKESALPDFYLPDHNLYIEYFGWNTPEYIEKRDRKIKMYQSDKSIRFEYLTYEDDTIIHDRLKEICRKYSISIQ